MTCAQCHDSLAAYADQALDTARREQVAAHLVGCTGCRRELAEILELRSLLGRTASQQGASTPASLADRLVAIAGPEAGQELCLSRGGACALPSRRRRRRRALGYGTAGGALALAALGGTVWLVAPELPAVDDPDASSQAALHPSVVASSTASAAASVTTGAGATSSVAGASASLRTTGHCPEPFVCPSTVGALALGTVLVDSAVEPSKLRASYTGSDGEVDVVEQRGRLAGSTDVAAPRVARAWQSGPTVYCVIADSAEQADEVAAALPAPSARATTPVERLRAGWHVLTGSRGR